MNTTQNTHYSIKFLKIYVFNIFNDFFKEKVLMKTSELSRFHSFSEFSDVLMNIRDCTDMKLKKIVARREDILHSFVNIFFTSQINN